MKTKNSTQQSPYAAKRKLLAAISMLLLSALLLGTVTFAWLTMSLAPEVRGVATNIGANGSLEIALLDSETRQDLSLIKTSVGGQSLMNNTTTANNTWGNLVDLNDESYGLNDIVLMPARLNAAYDSASGKYTLDGGLLSVPTYGHDGRIIELTDNTFSGIYNKDENFSYNPTRQDYGVRAIGTSNVVSAQGAALALAKTYILSYMNSANSAAASSIKNNGDALIGIMIKYQANRADAVFNDSDIDSLRVMIADVTSSANYIDLAIRQAIIAYVASEVSNATAFGELRDMISNKDHSISATLADEKFEEFEIPTTITNALDKYNTISNSINAALSECNKLSGGSYSWAQIRAILNYVINLDNVYIGDKTFSEVSSDDLAGLLSGNIRMTLASNSGVYADIADSCGDISTWITAMGSQIEVVTLSTVNPKLLQAVLDEVNTYVAAGSDDLGDADVNITSTYGYAIDLAFRCNAPVSDLLLQTEALQRIYENSDSPSTMGGGSYMEFDLSSDNYTIEQSLLLMDAVRVAFVDDTNTILGIAKLNTSNRVIENETIKAPLYLYEFSLSDNPEDLGALVMGERRKLNNTITPLAQSSAKAVTALVWLDGDVVDNTMVSADSETSLNGILNLQFASSADLVAAHNSDLFYLTPDKENLRSVIDTHDEVYESGQRFYTTSSWASFAQAYEFAVNVYDSASANEVQIFKAIRTLTIAAEGLTEVDLSALKLKIDEVRAFVGTTTDIARYVFEDVENELFYGVSEYTEEMRDRSVGTIYKVDNNNNLRDEGNGVMTPIYTEQSWLALADALYEAEIIYNHNKYTLFEEIDSAITALESAAAALSHKVFFMPYDYEGDLYYKAISDEPDTYGKWYDSDMKRIVSDLRILQLDAHATETSIVKLNIDEYLSYGSQVIIPTIEILSNLYPELSEDSILAVHWNDNELFTPLMTIRQKTTLKSLIYSAEALGLDATVIGAANVLVENEMTTREDAETAISQLALMVSEAEAAVNSQFMTSNQRTVLITAISTAKSVDGYYDVNNAPEADRANINGLISATNDAEALLISNPVSYSDAAQAIDNLNNYLVLCGKTEVTEYNTIIHSLDSYKFEVEHTLEYHNNMFVTSGLTGTSEVSAVVLTKNGVVTKFSSAVTVYKPADGVQITPDFIVDEGITKGTTATLTVDLIQELVEVGEDGQLVSYIGETIKECKWSSSDTLIASILDSSANSCTVTTPNNYGNVEISVTVITVEGNSYTTSIEFDVTVPNNP